MLLRGCYIEDLKIEDSSTDPYSVNPQRSWGGPKLKLSLVVFNATADELARLRRAMHGEPESGAGYPLTVIIENGEVAVTDEE